jgi:NOL1/NOP2/fmu family ribosome biogenesis protein
MSKEKELTIALLKEKIEKLTGKKVTLKEANKTVLAVDDFRDKLIELGEEDFINWVEGTVFPKGGDAVAYEFRDKLIELGEDDFVNWTERQFVKFAK